MKETYFEKAITYGVLREALSKCCRGVRWKDSVVGFELHAPQNILALIEAIKNGEYEIQKYQTFVIHEPKERTIVATRLPDRVVQMALCIAGLYEDITEHFIRDNSACQIKRGTDDTMKRIKTHLRRYYVHHGRDGWVLKCDIHHFFPSTRHDVAKQAVRKRVIDADVLEMVDMIIDSFGDDGVGIGLGSQISQLIELAVLDDLDHFIKERLHIKYYHRYMDDFVLIHEDKKYLQYCYGEIKKFVENLGLTLNDKTTLYPLKQGVKMLHWNFTLTSTGKILVKMDKTKLGKERRKLKKLLAKEVRSEVPEGTAKQSLEAFCANADKGDTFFQQKRIKAFYEKEWEKAYECRRKNTTRRDGSKVCCVA